MVKVELAILLELGMKDQAEQALLEVFLDHVSRGEVEKDLGFARGSILGQEQHFAALEDEELPIGAIGGNNNADWLGGYDLGINLDKFVAGGVLS